MGLECLKSGLLKEPENKIMSEQQRRVKQVIVWRKDLKVRSGKMAAQVAHAAMGPIFNMMNRIDWDDGSKIIDYAIHTDEDSPFVAYKEGRFTKVVVGIESEAELLALVERLKGTNIPHALICDAGLTEFKGVPTNTCLGIGPWWSDEIDQFTGSLPLM